MLGFALRVSGAAVNAAREAYGDYLAHLLTEVGGRIVLMDPDDGAGPVCMIEVSDEHDTTTHVGRGGALDEALGNALTEVALYKLDRSMPRAMREEVRW